MIASTRKFESRAFSGVNVFVIANAYARNVTDPAYTEGECAVIRDWGRDGGSLPLINGAWCVSLN